MPCLALREQEGSPLPRAAAARRRQRRPIQDLAKEAAQIFERAKALQKQGDWAGYGEQLKKLEQALKQMSGK